MASLSKPLHCDPYLVLVRLKQACEGTGRGSSGRRCHRHVAAALRATSL